MPKTLDNVARIRPPSATRFIRDYVLRARPVVLEGFLDRPGIGRITRSLAAHDPTLAPVLAPSTSRRLIGGEHPRTISWSPPSGTRALLPYARLPFADDEGSEMWSGTGGAQTECHWDLDLRANVLVQLYGRKRITIFPPAETQKLMPSLRGDRPQFSSLDLTRLSPTDRLGFLRFANAYDTVIGPGDAIFIPTAHWHHIEYVDATSSITRRLGRNQMMRALHEMIRHMWPSEVQLIQGVAPALVDERHVPSSLARATRRLSSWLRAAVAGNAAANERFVDALVTLHERVCPGRLTGPIFRLDDALFVRRTARRPPTSTPSRGSKPIWTAGSTVWLQPGFEVLTPLSGASTHQSLVVVDAAGVVDGTIPLPAGLEESLCRLFELLARRGRMTIAGLARQTGFDVRDLIELLSAWSTRDWITSPPA